MTHNPGSLVYNVGITVWLSFVYEDKRTTIDLMCNLFMNAV